MKHRLILALKTSISFAITNRMPILILFCLVLAVFFSRAGTKEWAPSFPLSFGQGSQWTGKAEIAEYEGDITRYGQKRHANLILVSVLEPFDLKETVKSETGIGAVTAFKQNQVLTYQTGVYPYRQMNSLFWNPGSGALWKAVMTTQEWCGQTFKEVRPMPGGVRMTFHSYWQGEASGDMRIKANEFQGPPILYDELPMLVRSPAFAVYRRVQVFPLLMSSQVFRPDWDIYGERRKPEFERARVLPDTISVAGLAEGRKLLRIVVEVQRDGRTLRDVFYVDSDSPSRTLLRWERHDGSTLTLKRVTFSDYWRRNHNGDTL